MFNNHQAQSEQGKLLELAPKSTLMQQLATEYVNHTKRYNFGAQTDLSYFATHANVFASVLDDIRFACLQYSALMEVATYYARYSDDAKERKDRVLTALSEVAQTTQIIAANSELISEWTSFLFDLTEEASAALNAEAKKG